MVEFLSHPVVAIVFLLGILIFVHELGHFIVGKLFGIGVEVFSIGFGPTLISFQFRNTLYRIAWLPLGGYVKFAGDIHSENVPKEFRGKEFYNASSFAQMCTVFAGPFSNLLLAAFVYAILGAQGIQHPAPIIGQIRNGSPAEQAGLRSGDKVTSINGHTILSWTDLQEHIADSPDKKLDIEVLRKNSKLHFEVVPAPIMREDLAGRNRNQGRIGIGYGFLPPVIDLLTGLTPARKQGVKAGLEVKKVQVAGKTITITTWDEFLEALYLAYEQKVDSINIDFFDPESKINSNLLFKTNAWWKRSKSKTLEKSDLAHALGFADSQMTLQTVNAPANENLKAGDRILAVENKALEDVYALSELLEKNEKEVVQIKIQRAEQVLFLPVKLKGVEVQKPSGKATYYTLTASFRGALVPPPMVTEQYSELSEIVSFGVMATVQQSKMLLGVIGGLFMGEVPLKVLGGPILIAKVAEVSVKQGLQTFFMTLPLISINLGILNFIPIPALDGGKLLVIALEAIMRRRMKPAFIENFQKVGFVMLLSLMVLATYNDLSRFWSSILQGLIGVFK